jgi:hypothetical protein
VNVRALQAWLRRAGNATATARWPIGKLDRSNPVDAFDCGHEDLNRYLRRFALNNQSASSAQICVAIAANRVINYYSLAVGAVAHAEAPTRVVKDLARHPVPVMQLAWLAVNNTAKGQGLGAALLYDALSRTLQVADIAGTRAILAHAKGDEVRCFYEYFYFYPSPTDD